MGADFYIRIYLKIEHNNGISYYELRTQRGYFFEFGNNDYCYEDGDLEDLTKKEANNKLYTDMINYCLTPKKDLIIYKNNNFINNTFEQKYLPFIKDKIIRKAEHNKDNIFLNISEITQITLCEDRYEV